MVGGVAPPPGDSLWAQSRYLAADGALKNFLLNEPRGGVFRHVNLLVPPKHPDAAMGCIIMEPASMPPMSGSNAMCVATVLLETGLIEMQTPITEFGLEMPGGLVPIRAHCRDGKVERVQLTNVASFVDRMAVPLELEGGVSTQVDIAFGGDSFVVVDAATFGFALQPDEARDLAHEGMRIAQAAQEQIGFEHPTLVGMNEITFCLFTSPVQQQGERRVAKHAVAIRPGKIDRSPTGTAVSARLALMHARRQAQLGDEVVFRSILGSEFVGRIERETEIAGRSAIHPSVIGRAWITGTRQLMLDPSDPWPQGYRMGDTWPGA